MSYLIMVSHGAGPRYVWGKEIDSLLKAEELAKSQSDYLNSNRRPHAQKVKVTVLRKVVEYGFNG